MKKGIYSILGAAAFAGLAVINFNMGINNDAKSDAALANIEALAQGETSDEYTAATCCVACICEDSCAGCDGRTHKHAQRK